MPWRDAEQLIAEARREGDKRQQELWGDLLESYGTAYRQLRSDADYLLEEFEGDGEPEAETVGQSHNYRGLLALWLLGLGGFVTLSSYRIRQEQSWSVMQGTRDALGLMRAMLPSKVTQDDLALLGVAMSGLSDIKQRDLLYRLQTRFPLEDLLREAAGKSYTGVGGVLVRGIRQGWTRRQIVDEVRQQAGVGLSRSLRIVNTEIHRAYTESLRLTYQQHPDLVEAMVRRARRDRRTCIACLMRDGEIYPLDRSLDDHPNGRCWLQPRLMPMKELGIDARDIEGPRTSGREWFEAQPESTQRFILGNKLYDVWQAGRVNLVDMPHKVSDPVWGDSWVPRSVRDILGEEA